MAGKQKKRRRPKNSRRTQPLSLTFFRFCISSVRRRNLPFSFSPANKTMPFSRYVEIGRVALVNYGADAGKLVVITDVVEFEQGTVFRVSSSSFSSLSHARSALCSRSVSLASFLSRAREMEREERKKRESERQQLMINAAARRAAVVAGRLQWGKTDERETPASPAASLLPLSGLKRSEMSRCYVRRRFQGALRG